MNEPLHTDPSKVAAIEDSLTGVPVVDLRIVTGELDRIELELARLELWFAPRRVSETHSDD